MRSFNVSTNNDVWGIEKLCKEIAGVCFCLMVIMGSEMHATAQTSIAVDGGGTLTFTANTDVEPCTGLKGFQSQYETTSYTNLSYSNGSTTTPLTGLLVAAISGSTVGGSCPKSKPTQRAYTVSPFISVNFTGDGTGNASAVATTLSTVDPAYKVVSILYATPGNFSSDSFTNSTTTGTNTTIGSSFTEGVTESFNLTPLGNGAGFGFGTSTTTGNSSSFTETITDATSTVNSSGGSANTINHNQDVVLIWLNPEVSLTQVGSNVAYSIGLQSLNGATEPPDILPIVASAMEDNASHHTNVALGLLEPQANGTPGLANVCAHLNVAEYQSLSCTMSDQCGCLPSDFAPILAQDPLLRPYPAADTTTADTPISADVSGALCGSATSANSATSADNCRYVPVPSSPGSQFQQITALEGLSTPNGNRIINSFTETDANTTTKTLSGSTSESVSYTVKTGFPLLGSFSTTTTWTWTDNQSVGAINGTANQIGYSLSSNTLNCAQDVLVFEDTIFHTFVTEQAPGNSTCP